jgi:hypothetical protein
MAFPQAPLEAEKSHVNQRKSDKKRNILTVYLTLNYSNGLDESRYRGAIQKQINQRYSTYGLDLKYNNRYGKTWCWS